MMIAFTQGLQSAGETYGSRNALAPHASKAYSPSSLPQANALAEKKSFARTVHEVRSEVKKNTELKKNKVGDEKRAHSDNQKGNDLADANLVKARAEEGDKKVAEKKSVNKDKGERGRDVRISAKKHKRDESEVFIEVEKAEEHIESQKLHAPQERTVQKERSEVNDDERESVPLKTLNALETIEKNDSELAKHGEANTTSAQGKKSENSFFIAEMEHDKRSPKFVGEVQERAEETEGGEALQAVHDKKRGAIAQKVQSSKETGSKITEESLAFAMDDEIAHDEQNNSKAQLRGKLDKQQKSTEGAARLDISSSDETLQKPQVFSASSETSLNAVHEKTSSVRGATNPMFEKKALGYLEQQGNQRLVQDARLVFRENNTGNIRLQLNPKELGEVKLMVKLDESNLVHARAVVSSEEAKDIMQKNLGNLAKHFNSEGYEIGSFSVSVNAEPSDTNDGTQKFFEKHQKRSENAFVAHIEERARSYVRVWQSIDFVA